jgi:putative ABC transport system permease protein
MRMSELESRGLTPADARVEALRRLGDVDDLRAYCIRTGEHAVRLARASDWITEWGHDLRLAVRQLRRAPAFTTLACLTLALGIGANTAIFSVVHTLLLDPLPYPGGDEIVGLRQQAGDADMYFPVDAAALKQWRDRARSLDAFSAASTGRVALGDPKDADTVVAAAITPGFFETLKIRPDIGRPFTVADVRGGAGDVALISRGFWESRFGGVRDAIGQRLTVNGKPRTIIGTLPARTAVPFVHGTRPDVWIPLDIDHLPGGANAFARLRPGVTSEVASRELQEILESSPDASRYTKTHARAMRSQEFLDPREVRTIEVLFAAVGVLLLIACANVANLLLARSWSRRREFAIRAVLGAGRQRLVRQILTESTSLAVVAGAIGVVIAWQGLRVIIALRPPTLIELGDIHLEPAVLAWSAGISIATGILFGSVPAFLAGWRIASDSLRATGHVGASLPRTRLRSALVVLEIALSVMLLIGAALLVRSFVALQRMPLGYEPHNLVSIGGFFRGPDVARRAAIRDGVLERLRSLPGVERAAVGSLPGQGWSVASTLEADGNDAAQSADVREFTTTFISSDYFRTAGMTLIAGRTLDSSLMRSAASTPPKAPGEVVISAALAKKFWPNGNAIGGRLRTSHSSPWLTVVGVIADVRMPGIRAEGAALQLYTYSPAQIPGIAFVVRSKAAASVLLPALRRAVAEAGPELAVGLTLTGDDYLRDGLAPSRFAMALLATFAAVALVLSSVGLYGVIAYSVNQRTREIGVRVALGADANAIAGLVVGNGVRLTALGVCFGVAGALATSRSLDSMLYGVTPSDPVSFAAIPSLLGAIALIASYVPMRRALHVDPVEAMRSE